MRPTTLTTTPSRHPVSLYVVYVGGQRGKQCAVERSKMGVLLWTGRSSVVGAVEHLEGATDDAGSVAGSYWSHTDNLNCL